MKYTKPIALLASAVLLTGCGIQVTRCGPEESGQAVPAKPVGISGDLTAHFEAQPVQTEQPDDTFRAAYADFSLGLLQRTAAGSGNLMISPYSVMQALGMTANGAAGDTLAGIEQALGGQPVDRLNGCLASWRTGQPKTANCMLTTANSIWIRDAESVSVRPEFLQKNVDYYAAGAFLRDFSDGKTCKDINKWIDANTMHMIPKVLDGISPDAVMYLVNAVAFDAKWLQTYEKKNVSTRTFYAADGTEQTADMMYSDETVYLEDEHAAGFMRPYDGGRYYFAALLPDEDTPIADYIAGLTAERLNAVFRSAKQAAVHAGIPKFSCDYDTDLSEALADMGMAAAFSGAADFSGMTDTPVQISRVLHNTHIEVDEKGTKAAASTVVEMRKNAEAPMPGSYTVILDRPFLFAIFDMECGMPVFLGVIRAL